MEGLLAAFRNLGPARILAMFIGLAAVIAIGGLTVTRLSQPGLSLLYGGLSSTEATRITELLQTGGVQYELRGEGAVYVPADQVGQLRLRVAGAGLVGGGGSGYELFDSQSTFGTTNFVQNLNAKRALEGELARTIATLPAVQGARVHLVLPRQSLFSREQTPPSAAVALNLGNRLLEEPQVQSIAQLVAAAVPNLTAQHVTIIDQRGTTLFNGSDLADPSGTGTRVTQQLEKSYESALTSLLERAVGIGKAAVRVTARLNLDQVQESSESYDPTQQVVRSEQTIESTNTSADGASNPPVGVQGNTPGGAAGLAGGGAQSNESRTETTTNYEIGKTVRQLSRKGGEVQQLSVAVLVEGRTTTDETGATTYAPLSDAQKADLRRLIEGAIGFNAERGDKVEIVDMQFSAPPEPEEVATPFITMPQILQIGQTALLVAGLIVVALVVVKPALGVLIRALDAPARGVGPLPAMHGAGPLSAPGQLVEGGEGAEATVDIARVDGRVRESSVKKINEIVDHHPEESLAVIRGWMAGSNPNNNS